MVIVISNREVNKGATDESLFGEQSNQKGLDEIRLAEAAFDSDQDRWSLKLVPEPDGLTSDNLPSRQLFKRVIKGVKDKTFKSNWVFFIHGFNQSFRKTLDTSYAISQKYGVEVIVFSWTSNPGGFVNAEYQRALQAAKASSNAIDHALETLGRYLRERSRADIEACDIKLSLLAHSLGNYIIEQFVRNPIFSGETRIFDNIIFHQADVDNRRHRFWLDRVEHGRRLYVTINENDSVLKASDLISPARLGNTRENLTSKRAIYIDFTDGEGVDKEHNFFLGDHDNPIINNFFKYVLTGRRGELVDGLKRNDQDNVFYL